MPVPMGIRFHTSFSDTFNVESLTINDDGRVKSLSKDDFNDINNNDDLLRNNGTDTNEYNCNCGSNGNDKDNSGSVLVDKGSPLSTQQ